MAAGSLPGAEPGSKAKLGGRQRRAPVALPLGLPSLASPAGARGGGSGTRGDLSETSSSILWLSLFRMETAGRKGLIFLPEEITGNCL